MQAVPAKFSGESAPSLLPGLRSVTILRMGIPAFTLLADDEEKRSRLIVLRNGVQHLLSGNYLSHFTDHSVAHSDQLCELVDKLAASLGDAKRLNAVEAAVLYGSCYYHDAGMQHASAGDTDTVKSLLRADPYQGQSWLSLTNLTQQEIVRRCHHQISHELVLGAFRARDTPLGIALTDDDKPGVIAALCLAHCLPTDDPEYREATADQGGIRVGLLSALLRLADILDESQRRTHLNLQTTTTLNLESRLHWWRHHYVSDITVEQRAVTVWFDFPLDRREDYKVLLAQLQLPKIESEFRRHSVVLAANGLAWHIQVRDTPPIQCVALPMDDDLEQYAVKLAVRRQNERRREDLRAAVGQLRFARPTIKRQFAALRESSESDEDQMTRALSLAEHLTAIGGVRDGWMSLQSEFQRLKANLNLQTRMSVALRLGQMMVMDDASENAAIHLQEFVPHFSKLGGADPMKKRFTFIWATVLRERCDYIGAVMAFDELSRATDSPDERAGALAEIDEMHLLQGELGTLNIFRGGSC